MKFVISYNTKFGSVSAEGENTRDLARIYPDLERVAKSLDSERGRSSETRQRIVKIANLRANRARKSKSALSKRKGRAETTRVLAEIESALLSSSFFSRPRSTGETREKLEQLSGRRFTSRKVSQALGLLKISGVLRRTGTRNHFKYSE